MSDQARFGSPLLTIVVLLALIATAFATSGKQILGTSVSPAHMPHQRDSDIRTFFDEAAQIGSHLILIAEWKDLPPLSVIANVRNAAAVKGLKFHLYISPIFLGPKRDRPDIPASVDGKSFAKPAVRDAYKQKVLELAGLRPDYLGLATEVNFLAQNPLEYNALHSLLCETYSAVKQKYPAQIVTFSFQWEVLHTQPRAEMLKSFANCLDVYSFTTYPNGPFHDPAQIPPDYYREVRKLLPTQPLGFAEVGWNSEIDSTEELQAQYYARIPELMRGVHPDFLLIAMMHDVDAFSGELRSLNSSGVRHNDGTPKRAWDVIVNMPDID